MNEPQYERAVVAEDGSAVEIQLSNGSSLRFGIAALKDVIRDLIIALNTANANVTRREPGEPTSDAMEEPPPTVLASKVYVTWMPESDAFSVDASDRQNRRVIAVLREGQMRHLIQVYQERESRRSGQKPN
jgi:hypothetical protein